MKNINQFKLSLILIIMSILLFNCKTPIEDEKKSIVVNDNGEQIIIENVQMIWKFLYDYDGSAYSTYSEGFNDCKSEDNNYCLILTDINEIFTGKYNNSEDVYYKDNIALFGEDECNWFEENNQIQFQFYIDGQLKTELYDIIFKENNDLVLLLKSTDYENRSFSVNKGKFYLAEK